MLGVKSRVCPQHELHCRLDKFRDDWRVLEYS